MEEEIKINSKPFEYTLSLFNGKWKMTILYWLSHYPQIRYGQLKREIKGITHKMLSQQLKELEQDGIIVRKEYGEVPPRVEYTLSDRGKTLMPILHEMCRWGHENMPENKDELSN
ncbi:winged helix-turn-helix transcriptional regulator [Anaerosporobacter faecicola]|uniref:winged helix-turn-helix transcriptional regulator n=1 Tax=Anaerosporobacter faecicola TaxID=2718714 RepID=UPI00143BA637|nr:helix-turn-helix domain-containing protein [Anaerosporobacter faecicola]